MIAVIADDITGAAEMAGIAHRLGLRVMLSTSPCPAEDTDVLVVATDTRSMTASEASAESAKAASAVAALPGVDHIFKKTDSALRGHVVAELESMLANTRYDRALYLPANPSKNRVIRGGVYYIGATPLHETDFSFDPEFPALSSVLDERFPGHEESGIAFADAVCDEDVTAAVAAAGTSTLLAGAADLFTAFLRAHAPAGDTVETKPEIDLTDAVIVCGSTQSKPVACGAETFNMPTSVYDGLAPVSLWVSEIAPAYSAGHSVILALKDRHRTGHESAVYLRGAMASAVASLMAVRHPKELIIEGGATAYAILSRLGWKSFVITDCIAPGVVRMLTPDGVHVTMKPGSYPWGNLF